MPRRAFSHAVTSPTQMLASNVRQQFESGLKSVKEGLIRIDGVIAFLDDYAEKREELHKVADELKHVIASLEQVQSHL